MGGHNLAVGMGSDFDLRDLLKPHLSPALPHWKRTRALAGQLDHNIIIANTLTFEASLMTSTTPHWNWTRVLAGQIRTHDLESLAYLPGTEEASTRSDKTIGRCTNERGKTLPKAWGKLLPEDLTANPKGSDPRFIDKQNILHTGRKGRNFLYF